MELLGRYKNGNFFTTILSDGTKIRETEDNEFIPDFAESMDIKITNFCDMGCPFCHEGSTTDGKFGDILKRNSLTHFIRIRKLLLVVEMLQVILI